MADIVDLRTRSPVTHADQFNAELVQDLARFSEGLVSEKDVRRRYKFDDSIWESLADNEALIAAIEDEKTRRVRSGALKRERAQALVTAAPGVLGEILLDKNNSPKHRIDSAKTLDSLASDKSSEGAAAGAKFEITINLGDDSLHFSKSIALTASDSDDSDPYGWDLIPIAAITAKKDDGGGQGHI